MIGPWNRSAL